MSQQKVRVLFVCMGNICRSPMAEAHFRAQVEAAGLSGRFVIDSAGTGGWHAGERPDARMRSTAADRGVEVDGAARQLREEDLHEFDHILCMDSENLRDVQGFSRGSAEVRRMLDFHPDAPTQDVPDPYYGGDRGFAQVFDLLEVATAGLLTTLVDRHHMSV